MAGLLAWVMNIPSARRPIKIHQFIRDRALALAATITNPRRRNITCPRE
jgi:hypothetical protein